MTIELQVTAALPGHLDRALDIELVGTSLAQQPHARMGQDGEVFAAQPPSRRAVCFASLLIPVTRSGRRVRNPEPIAAARERAATAPTSLPARLRSLQRSKAEPLFQPRISMALRDLAEQADRRIDAAMAESA